MELLHKDITDKIIKAFYKVYNELGYGFLEKVYENAMYFELTSMGFYVEQQRPVKVYYFGNKVGDYSADLAVENCVMNELKTAEVLSEGHEHQLVNYLKATEFEVGLLLNFGKKPEIRRKIFTNNMKKHLSV